MPSKARQKKIMEKLNRAQKCSILGPQNLGSRGAPGPPLDPHLVDYVFDECNKHIGVFLKWSRTFIEFRELRESDKSLKHELDSI